MDDTEQLTTIVPQETAIGAPVLLPDNARESLNLMFKLAQKFSNSTMIPTTYQHKPDDCFVACEIASRLGVSPLVVMQNLYVVQGRPSWSGQGAIALVNGSGLYTPLDFDFIGERGSDDFGCYASATRKSDGKLCKGTPITIQMAKKEGWYQKSGSKWQTMPDQMLLYRAGTFFARVWCPNVLMGFRTEGEEEDAQASRQAARAAAKAAITLDAED